MKSAKLLGLGILVAALAATGCETKTDPTKAPPAKAGGEGDHVHGNGPTGGVTFAVGGEHVELRVNHDDKMIAICFLQEVKGRKEKEWPPLPVAATEFTLTTKETMVKEGKDKGKVVPPMTIKLTPKDAKDGKASTFSGTDAGIGNVADFSGTVLGELAGKGAKGEFKE